MVSLLYLLGLVVGIVVAMTAIGGALIALGTALVWLNSMIVNARHAARRAQSAS